MKAAVYGATRNAYEDMIPSIKSLLVNSDVDKIYMLIEDDVFPMELPPECETINVSNQRYFYSEGPNYNSKWSYMILLRTAYTKLFPNLDRILSLDNDVIIKEDISDVWDINLNNCYFAAVLEPHHTRRLNRFYTCIGVSMMNLEKLRDGTDDRMIKELNTIKYAFPEQDVFNAICQGNIRELNPTYGMSPWTIQVQNPKVEHFAASNGKWRDYPIVKYYRDLQWSEIRKERK